MSEFAGVLRRARAEVIPQLPHLAPYLKDQSDVIQEALVESLERQDVDPEIIAPQDLNKTERHTIAGFVIGEQRKFLVEGKGVNAQFRTFATTAVSRIFGRDDRRIIPDVSKTLKRGIRHVSAMYRDGDDLEHTWWPLAKDRYAVLGKAMICLSDKPRTVPGEGQELKLGMATGALSGSVVTLSRFVGERMPYSSTEVRVRAAHDLSHLILAQAGMHFVDFARSKRVDELRGRIELDPKTDRFKILRSTVTNWEEVYRRRQDHESVTLKCPAHAATQEPGVDTNLTQFVHALINKTPEYDLL